MNKRLYPITREAFNEHVEPRIIEQYKKIGRPPKISHYNFFCGVLYILRTGIAWRDLLECFGNWHTIYMRFHRWSISGIFWNILYRVQQLKKAIIDVVFVDSSTVPTHRHGG